MRTNPRIQITLSMIIFGTIGLFVRWIPLSSALLALVRGVVGATFLLVVLAISKKKPDGAAIRKKLLWLVLSGASLGINWVLLFEAYRYTTVSTATLCYYMAPIFVILVSPLLLKQRLTGKKVLCVLVALAGMVLVSGVLQSGIPAAGELRGILMGLGAAVFYAAVVLLNQKLDGVGAYDKTVVQLGVSAVVMVVYLLFTGGFTGISGVTAPVIGLLLVVGVLHTGIAYALYFGAIQRVTAQTAALMSYIDPVVAILLSALVLREHMGVPEAVGAVLVLGATLVSELKGD